MKVAFVVPRYGLSVLGGAETAARLLAEHLVERLGWQVTVLTSCAEDFRTWDNFFPVGGEVIHGVQVERFRCEAGRAPTFEGFSAGLLDDPEHTSLIDAETWIDLQGPVVPDLINAARTTDADVMVFYPYLYFPTVRVIEAVSVPTVLHPAAHDETALRLPVFRQVFEAADGLVYHTAAERDLVQGLFPVASRRQLLLGLGVDDPDDMEPVSTSERPPFLLCLGRVDRGKGTTLLVELFARYKERHPGPLRLVMAGPVVHPPALHPDVDLLGSISEQEKWDLLRTAVALVSPSSRESFSLVIAEAWSARIPVLVNAACAATVEHCRRSGAGLQFADFAEFEVAVETLVTHRDVAGHLGALGRAYVDHWFRWPRMIDRYGLFLQSVVAGTTVRVGS